MKNVKKIGLIIIIASIPLIFIINFYGNIVMKIIAISNNIDITFTRISSVNISEFIITDLKISDMRNDFGLIATDAKIKFFLAKPALSSIATDFILKNVKFINNKSIKKAQGNNLDGIIAMPFESKWNYEELSGKFYSNSGDMRLDDFIAKGNSLKFTLTGILTKTSLIDADICIYINDKLFEKIPEEFTGAILKDEGDGWKSIAMKIKGDFSKPQLQISNKLFRLTIGPKK